MRYQVQREQEVAALEAGGGRAAEAVLAAAAAPNAACMGPSTRRRGRIGCRSWHSGAFEAWSKESGCGTVGIRGRTRGVG